MIEKIGWEDINASGLKAHLVVKIGGKVRTLCLQTRCHIGRGNGKLKDIPSNACKKCVGLLDIVNGDGRPS